MLHQASVRRRSPFQGRLLADRRLRGSALCISTLEGTKFRPRRLCRKVAPQLRGGVQSIETYPGYTRCFGPYQIVKEIGLGGAGVVYSAVHEHSGQRVAVKTVRAREAALLSSIRREIRTLRRLTHPGIVRIVDDGITDGQPWYAMPLHGGPTLRDWIDERWKAQPPPTPSLRRPAAAGDVQRGLALIRSVCEALGFLHDEGITHGDLKPENIFLGEDGSAVIADFDLAWQIPGARGREVIEDSSSAGGTLIYMAPEQLLGEPIDLRCDLYALGCILYELMCGCTARGGERALEWWSEGRNDPLVPLSTLATGVSPQVDSLTEALLAWDRRRRPGHVTDVIAVLDSVLSPGSESPAKGGSVHLYRPRLVGRDRIIGGLVAAAARARAGEGSAVLVGGESGIGKTYLATELARRWPSRQLVAICSCAPIGGGHAARAASFESLEGLFQKVADLCVEGGESVYEELLGADGGVLGRYVGALADLPGCERHPPGALPEGPAAREWVLAAVLRVIENLARRTPLLWVIDDLQWADEMTLALVRTVPPDWFRRQRLLFVGTYRTDEAPDALTEVARRGDFDVIELGGVDAASARELALDMLAVCDLPGQLVEFLQRQSQGNPFHIAEYLRAGISEGVFCRVGGHVVRSGEPARSMTVAELDALPLPSRLRDLVARRLQSLSAEARAFVETAAVVGRHFDADVVRVAAEMTPESCFDAVHQLLQRQIIEHSEVGTLRFVHDKQSEIAYERIAPDRRQQVHARVARALVEQAGDESQGLSALLAHHWSCAGEPAQELRHRVAAGRAALDAAAFNDATEHLRRALELAEGGSELDGRPVGGARKAQWELWIAQAEHGRGDVPRAERHAIATLARVGYRWPGGTGGWVAMIVRQFPLQLVYRMLRPPTAATDPEQQAGLRAAARAAELLTHRYFYVENTPAMLASAFLAANLADRAPSREEVPKAFIAVAFLARVVGLKRLAGRAIEVASDAIAATSDAGRRADGLASESVYQATFGDMRLAGALADDALECLAQVNDPYLKEMVWTTCGHVEFFTGRFAEARRSYERVLESARGHGNSHHAAWGLFSIARSDVAVGRYAEAAPGLEEALAILQQRPELQSEITCWGLLASARIRLGDRKGAGDAVQAALPLIGRAQPAGFPTVEGYAAVLDALLELEPIRSASTRTALTALRRFARVIPMAKPIWLLREAAVARAAGRVRVARRCLQRARDSAEQFSMPRERALALIGLGAMEPADAGGDPGAEGRRQLAALGHAPPPSLMGKL